MRHRACRSLSSLIGERHLAAIRPLFRLLPQGDGMKINGNEIRPGNVLMHQDTLWVAVKTDHVKPGKGGAFAQVELKNLLDGRKLRRI